MSWYVFLLQRYSVSKHWVIFSKVTQLLTSPNTVKSYFEKDMIFIFLSVIVANTLPEILEDTGYITLT